MGAYIEENQSSSTTRPPPSFHLSILTFYAQIHFPIHFLNTFYYSVSRDTFLICHKIMCTEERSTHTTQKQTKNQFSKHSCNNKHHRGEIFGQNQNGWENLSQNLDGHLSQYFCFQIFWMNSDVMDRRVQKLLMREREREKAKPKEREREGEEREATVTSKWKCKETRRERWVFRRK